MHPNSTKLVQIPSGVIKVKYDAITLDFMYWEFNCSGAVPNLAITDPYRLHRYLEGLAVKVSGKPYETLSMLQLVATFIWMNPNNFSINHGVIRGTAYMDVYDPTTLELLFGSDNPEALLPPLKPAASAHTENSVSVPSDSPSIDLKPSSN